MPELQPAGRNDDSLDGTCRLVHSNCVWFFVARCDSEMPGRAEHTDTVAHDGTWHFQLRGAKRWYIRPTDDLMKRMQETACGQSARPLDVDSQSRLVVECAAGDCLLINTALWWHRTEIPCTVNTQDGLSISYARDVCLPAKGSNETARPEQEERSKAEDASVEMGNVDTFRVECDIEEGSVIFDQDDMPEVPMPTSSSPNCELIVWEPTGAEVLIASRDISEGERLTVAESSPRPCKAQRTQPPT